MSTHKNVASRKQVELDRKEDKRKELERLGDLKVVMSTPEGRKTMWHILNHYCHVDASSVQGNSGSEVFFREGERNVGRKLKSDMWTVAFSECQQMEKEYYDKLNLEKLLSEKEGVKKAEEATADAETT